jgi:hypothetical protein
VTAEHISQGSLFSTDFLQESIARVAAWQLLTDAEIDAMAADLRAIFNQFPDRANSKREPDRRRPDLADSCPAWLDRLSEAAEPCRQRAQ